jgi:hypothetical protein
VTLLGECNRRLLGYAVLDDAAAGGVGFRAAHTLGKGMGKRMHSEGADGEAVWFLRRRDSASRRSCFIDVGNAPRATFLPVIGGGDRCSVLAEVSYTLLHVAKNCLAMRDEEPTVRMGDADDGE